MLSLEEEIELAMQNSYGVVRFRKFFEKMFKDKPEDLEYALTMLKPAANARAALYKAQEKLEKEDDVIFEMETGGDVEEADRKRVAKIQETAIVHCYRAAVVARLFEDYRESLGIPETAVQKRRSKGDEPEGEEYGD